MRVNGTTRPHPAQSTRTQKGAGSELDAEAVTGYVRERLAGFKVPRFVAFADELPREESGKLFKRKLRDRYWPAGRAI